MIALLFLVAAAATLDLADAAGEAGQQLAAARAVAGEGDGAPATLTDGIGLGFPTLLAPAVAVGGDTAAAIWLALIATAGVLLTLRLARRVVPEPYASGGIALVALSAPAVALATVALPEMAAGTLLVAAMLLVVRCGDTPKMRYALAVGALLALLPWLDGALLIAGLPLLLVLARDLSRRGRGLAALLAVELVVASLLAWVSVNEALYNGITPGEGWSIGTDRLERLASLWLDRDFGILRWTPALVLAGIGVNALWRSRRDHVARAVPERAQAERVALLCLLVCVTQALVAALGTTSPDGPWFPGRTLTPALMPAAVLVAWGLQRMPRAGAALAAVTLAATAYLLIARESLHPPGTSAPWGPLDAVFPDYGQETAWGTAVAAGLATGALMVAVAAWRTWRGAAHVRH